MEKIISKHLSSEEIYAIAECVPIAYKAVDEIFKTSLMMGDFLPSRDLRPNLIGSAVQFQLSKINLPGFNSKIEKNAAKNCHHAVLWKGGLKVTAHYLGSTRPRKMARSAIFRNPYAAANTDVFLTFCSEPSDTETPNELYCQLYHYGFREPEIVWLAVPDNHQQGIIGDLLVLPKVDAKKLDKTEQIEDAIQHTLKTGVQNVEHEQLPKESNG